MNNPMNTFMVPPKHHVAMRGFLHNTYQDARETRSGDSARTPMSVSGGVLLSCGADERFPAPGIHDLCAGIGPRHPPASRGRIEGRQLDRPERKPLDDKESGHLAIRDRQLVEHGSPAGHRPCRVSRAGPADYCCISSMA